MTFRSTPPPVEVIEWRLTQPGARATASDQPSRLLWAVWIQWAALTIVVATAAAYALASFLPNLEAAQLTFAVGMAWSSLTPPVLRAIRRRIRG